MSVEGQAQAKRRPSAGLLATVAEGHLHPEKFPGSGKWNGTPGKEARGSEEEGRGRNAKVGLHMKSVFNRGGPRVSRRQKFMSDGM